MLLWLLVLSTLISMAQRFLMFRNLPEDLPSGSPEK
jgi:hypothetical protein